MVRTQDARSEGGTIEVPGDPAYLVLCGRQQCGEWLGFAKNVDSYGTDGHIVITRFKPRDSLLLRDGVWQLSQRAKRQYRRQVRLVGQGVTPKDRRVRRVSERVAGDRGVAVGRSARQAAARHAAPSAAAKTLRIGSTTVEA